MHQGKVIPLKTTGVASKRQYLLDEGRTITLKYLPALLQRMLDNADDILFDLADKAQSDQEQNGYFDAMRELRLARHTLESAFKTQLEASFTAFPQQADADQGDAERLSQLRSEDLSLVDEIDLEESLAITGMVAKIKSRYPRELYALEQRFQAISNAAPSDQIPIGASALCQAFAEATRALDIELKIKLIVYKLFDKHVLAHLQPLYDETNVLFIAAGVLPKLKMQVNKHPDGDAPKSPRAPDTGDIAWLDDSAVSPTQTSLDDGAGYDNAAPASSLQTLRSLLNARRLDTARPATAAGPAQTPRADAGELIAVLSRLQRFNLATSAEALHEFQATLAELKHSGSISAVDSDIIDIVDMLFDFILDDDNLPTIAKALLARLQIPMIKVALVDQGFFSEKQHPAKRLLNLMAKACVGLSNDITPQNCPLLASIEATVNRICAEFNDDLKLFDELLGTFEQFLHRESEREAQTLEANRQRSQAREQHALSRAWVTDVIAGSIDNQALPKPVFKLLDGPWKEVMINTYLNDGQESAHWQENLRFIELLIWSVELGNGKVDRQRLGRIIPELVGTLRQELEAVCYPPARVDALLADLEALHLAGLRGADQARHPAVKVKADPARHIPGHAAEEDINRELDAMRRSLAQLGDVDEMMDELLRDINPDRPNAEQSRRQAMAEALFENDVEEIVMSSEFINEKTIPEIDDHYWTMVQQLRTGQWISLMDNKGKQQKIKLSWKSDMLGECTFINWKFKVAADLTFNQLAAKFRAGQAALMENLPIFERAVDAVINSLQRRQAE